MDRYMLDRVSNIVLAWMARAAPKVCGLFAMGVMAGRAHARVKAKAHLGNQAAVSVSVAAAGETKLSYLEARDMAVVEQRLAEAQEVFETKRAQLEEPAIASDSPRL